MSIKQNLEEILSQIPKEVTLVAVSKTKPISDIFEAYHAGQRIFGENKVQEMVSKWEQMPKDIQWHLIGHLQKNKVKYMAPFVTLIHAVDSLSLLEEINKQAIKNNRVIDCLLQIYIAKEDTKFGLNEDELNEIIQKINTNHFQNIQIKGLMGMATFTENETQISNEFAYLNQIFQNLKNNSHPNIKMEILSMGMSGDFKIAIQNGSNMVRIGSNIFGNR